MSYDIDRIPRSLWAGIISKNKDLLKPTHRECDFDTVPFDQRRLADRVVGDRYSDQEDRLHMVCNQGWVCRKDIGDV